MRPINRKDFAMEGIMDSLLKGLFGSVETYRVEVHLPPGMTEMDVYQIFKTAAQEAGCTITDFKVKEESA